MVANLKDDSMRVQLEMSAKEYAALRALAAAHREAGNPDTIAEEIYFLPDYGALLTSAALEACQEAGYESFEALEAAAKADPVMNAEESRRLWERIVDTLRAAGVWVEEKNSEVK